MKIEFKSISKEYKKGIFGVKDINMVINGGVFGLLGRNGSGKTTLMQLLATILWPTSGKIVFDEKDLAENSADMRKRLGYLPQDSKLQPSLNIYEFLDYIALLKDIKDKKSRKNEVERCLEIVGLQDEKKKKLKAYSGGMLRRAGIAQALLGSPELLIVDEPTTGLDPEERLYFRNLISRIGREKTVILSTHIISDIEDICTDVGILDKGSIIYNGAVTELIKKVEGKVWECIVPSGEEDFIKQSAIVTAVTFVKDQSKIRYISEQSVYSASEKQQESMEDAYLYCIGGIKR